MNYFPELFRELKRNKYFNLYLNHCGTNPEVNLSIIRHFVTSSVYVGNQGKTDRTSLPEPQYSFVSEVNNE